MKRPYSSLKFAKSSPDDLMWSASYWWRHHKKAVTAVAVLVVSPLVLWVLKVIPILSGLGALFTGQIQRPEILALLIQAAIYLWIARQTLFAAGRLFTRLEVDNAVANVVNLKSLEELRLVQDGKPPRTLEEVKSLWPDNPTEGLATLRMCEAIRTDAMDNQYNSKEALLQNYREEFTSEIMAVQTRQRNALQLGILGTFIGLLFAMPHLIAVMQGGEAATDLFTSLRVCFSTSVVGLVVSLCIDQFVNQLLNRLTLFSRSLEEAATSTILVTRGAMNRSHVARTLEGLNRSLSDVHDRLKIQNHYIDTQTSVLQKGLKRLSLSRTNLESFLSGIDKVEERVSSAMTTIEGRLTPENYVSQVQKSIKDSLKGLSTKLAEGLQDVFQVLDTSSGALQEATTSLKSTGAAMSSQTESTQREIAYIERAYQDLNDKMDRGFETVLNKTLEVLSSEGDRLIDEHEKMVSAHTHFQTNAHGVQQQVLKQEQELLLALKTQQDSVAALHRELLEQLGEMDIGARISEGVAVGHDKATTTVREVWDEYFQRLNSLQPDQSLVQTLSHGQERMNGALLEGLRQIIKRTSAKEFSKEVSDSHNRLEQGLDQIGDLLTAILHEQQNERKRRERERALELESHTNGKTPRFWRRFFFRKNIATDPTSVRR